MSGKVRMRLYVAGGAPNSVRALANLQALCATHLEGRHELEVVDVYEAPERARADRVILTPLLLVKSAAPERRVLGDMGDVRPVMDALGIAIESA